MVDRLARISEFAAEVDVSEKMVRTGIRAGVVPVVKVGRGLRVDLARMPVDITAVLRSPLRARSGSVYFIGSEVGGIKIGVAVNPDARLATLQCGSPIPLRILATTTGGRQAERAYHRQFAVHRLHGEWFAPHPDILAEIDRLNSAD